MTALTAALLYLAGAALTFKLAHDYMANGNLPDIYRRAFADLGPERADRKARRRVAEIAAVIAAFWPVTLLGVVLDVLRRRKTAR